MSAFAAVPALAVGPMTSSSVLQASLVDAPLSERAQRVMQLASEYATQMGHWHLGTEHLMFALAQESEQSGTEWLDGLGVASEEIDCIVSYIIGYGKTTDRPEPVDTDLIASDNLTGCLEQAATAADDQHHAMIEPEHLMLGIIDSYGTTANLLLDEMWIERGSVRHVTYGSLGIA
jgi:ATP-dependent Clp protease ATP-binding subunit ClpA